MTGVPYVILEGGYELRISYTPLARAHRRWFWTAVELDDRSNMRSGRARTDEAAICDARAGAAELRELVA